MNYVTKGAACGVALCVVFLAGWQTSGLIRTRDVRVIHTDGETRVHIGVDSMGNGFVVIRDWQGKETFSVRGKKIFALLEKLKPLFIEGGKKNEHPEEVLEKIWKDWEAFAAYAFNKSHSTCYAFIAYQTAYLKAHYPAEYMASVLSNNMNDIKQVSFFM